MIPTWILKKHMILPVHDEQWRIGYDNYKEKEEGYADSNRGDERSQEK